MISGMICLYNVEGQRLSARSYHSYSARRDILRSWRETYFPKNIGCYYEVSPDVNSNRVNLDGTNSDKFVQHNVFIPKDERDILNRRYQSRRNKILN